MSLVSTLGGVPLACSGHVLIDLPIFMGPVVVLAGWLVLMSRRARRQERLEQGPQADTHAKRHAEANDRKIGENLLGVHA